MGIDFEWLSLGEEAACACCSRRTKLGGKSMDSTVTLFDLPCVGCDASLSWGPWVYGPCGCST